MADIDLLTLDELKVALNIDPTDNRLDTLQAQAITDASRAIMNFTERDFGSPAVTETRDFEYDGSGYLEIDDADSVTDIAMKVVGSDPLPVDATTWAAMPTRSAHSPVYFYVILPEVVNRGVSPAMGFTRNLDQWAAEHGMPQLPTLMSVTGTWGWPIVPEDVKRAAIWTVREWTTSPDADEDLSSEAIAGFARSWGGQGGSAKLAIPNAARDLLAAYQRQRI